MLAASTKLFVARALVFLRMSRATIMKDFGGKVNVMVLVLGFLYTTLSVPAFGEKVVF